MDRERLVNRINQALDLPMAILSMVMLALVVIDLTVVVAPETTVWLERANWLIWGVFALEFAFKLLVAPNKRRYMQRHWFDALVVIVPMFRVVRALRILHVTKAYPIFRLVAYIGRSSSSLRVFFAERRLGYLAALTVLVTVLGAAGVYMLERDAPGTRFLSFGDSLWWSAALMTSVGSDLNPQTPLGRLLAVGLMIYAMVVVVYLISALSAHLLRGERPAPAITMAPREPEEAEIDRALGDESLS